MLLRIQKYDFTVKYLPGKNIPIADGLSRLPIHGDEIPYIDVIIHDITDVSESRLEKIKNETKCDETLQALARTEIDENATSYTEIRLHREICAWKEHTHCRWTFTSSYSWR